MRFPSPRREISTVDGGRRETTTSMASTATSTTMNTSLLPPRCRDIFSLSLRVGSYLLTLLGFLMFVLGLSGNIHVVIHESGWDEVFAVIGSFCFFHIAVIMYHWVSHMSSVMMYVHETKFCFHALQLLLLLAYTAQQAVLMAYLIRYVGRFCLFFMIPDVAVVVMIIIVVTMMTNSLAVRVASQWPSLYVLVLAGKLGVLWPKLEGSMMYAERLGADGLLGALMLTIPVTQFPVLISWLRVGMSLTRAYTTNMTAVFAHVLHFMDVLDLYFSGMEMRRFFGDIKLLALFFAIMGHIACCIYYFELFLKYDEGECFMRLFEEPDEDDTDLIARTEPTRDDELLHYFIWTFFFIDLPYAVLRLVSLAVNGSGVSIFLAKNIMMIVSVVMLLVRGQRS